MKHYKWHVLCWSHMDREWNQPFEVTRADVMTLMDDLLDLLERRQEFSFYHLDGQVVPLIDYLELRPENRGRIEKLVRSGRLLIGPWYTLPEMNEIYGECVSRNLQYGEMIGNTFGGIMKVGFSNTGWGQISQLPQIFRSFGLDTATCYRGVPVHRIEKECLWEGADGSRIMLVRPPRGGRAMFLFKIAIPAMRFKRRTAAEMRNPPPYPSSARVAESLSAIAEPYYAEDNDDPAFLKLGHIKDAVEWIRKNAAPDATTGNLFLGNWQDRAHPNQLTPELVAEARKYLPPGDRIFISNWVDYLAAVKKERRGIKVQVRGELRWPQKGKEGEEMLNVLSSRSYVKVAERKAEAMLIYGGEEWAALASVYGFGYPRASLDYAWKILLTNHCHDTIGGVSIDRVHEDQMNRYARIVDVAGDLRRRSVIDIARRIRFKPANDNETCLVLFNSIPGQRSDVVDCHLDVLASVKCRGLTVEDLAGKRVPCEVLSSEVVKVKSYRRFDAYSTSEMKRFHVRLMTKDVPGVGYATYRVKAVDTVKPLSSMGCGKNWMENEHLRVSFRKNGTFDLYDKHQRRTFSGMGWLEDTGNIESAWVYQPTANEKPLTSSRCTAKVKVVENTGLRTSLRVELVMRIPEQALPDGSGRSKRLVPVAVSSVYTLERGSPLVRVVTTVNNTAKDHRLRVIFQSIKRAKHGWADAPYDVIRRPAGMMDTKGWKEQDDGCRPMLSFVDVSDGRTGLALMTKGLCEYQLYDDEPRTLALTLIKGFRVRQFRYVNMPDPVMQGSQSPGINTFEYALYPHAGNWEKAGVNDMAFRFNVPMTVVQRFGAGVELPPTVSLVGVESGKLMLSAVKRSEDGRGLIVRIFNPTARQVVSAVRFGFPVKRVDECTMGEKAVKRLRGARSVRVVAGPKKVVTLKVTTA